MDEARILAPMETGSTIVDDSQVSDLIMVLRKLVSVTSRKALHPIVYLIGGVLSLTVYFTEKPVLRPSIPQKSTTTMLNEHHRIVAHSLPKMYLS